MPKSGRIGRPSRHPEPAEPDDNFLIASLVGGDAAALTVLMDRYDRLVRYAILRANREQCRKDPHWLESVASDTWVGFIRSLQRDPDKRPQSVPAYLTRIARNQWITALRRTKSLAGSVSVDQAVEALDIAATDEDPGDLISRLEGLEALRQCVSKLDESSRNLFSQLSAITERRWRDAARALGMRESTLRSRWKTVLERLRRCLRERSPDSVAPTARQRDH